MSSPVKSSYHLTWANLDRYRAKKHIRYFNLEKVLVKLTKIREIVCSKLLTHNLPVMKYWYLKPYPPFIYE